MNAKYHTATLLGVVLLVSLPNFAGAAEDPVIEEIIVSATYRDTKLMDTPIAISAIDEVELLEKGITDIQSLYQAIPGLSYRTNSATYNNVSIRGLTNPGGGGTVVGIYVDDIPVTDGTSGAGLSQTQGTLYDVARVEVLKGPQGTLYGEGNMGGAIRYITNRADPNAFDASIRSNLSDSNESDDLSWLVAGMVNVPLIDDKLALRVAGQYRDRAGFLDIPIGRNEDDVNDSEQTAIRTKLAWYVTDTLTVDATVAYYDTEYGGPNLANGLYSSTELSSADWENRFSNGGVDEHWQYNIAVHWELPFAEFLSSTSYFDREVEYAEQTAPRFAQQFNDGLVFLLSVPFFAPGVPNPFFDPTFPPFATAVDAVGGTGLFTRRTERIVQEFRLVSTSEGPWQWTAGAYFKDQEAINGDTSRPSIGITMLPGFEPWQDFFNSFVGGSETKVDSSELAAYGELSYAFNDQFSLLVGARVSNVEKEVDGISDDVDDTLFSPKVTLTYRPTEDLMFYGTFSQGFRPGLVNTLVINEIARLQGFAALVPAIVDPQIAFLTPLRTIDGDEVFNYELGFKATLWDGRMTIATALYYMDWRDVIQNQQFFGFAATLPIIYNVDSGDAHTQGIELEVDVALTDNLTLHVGGDWNEEAEIESFSQGQFNDINGNPIAILPGNRLANAPEFSFNAALDYGFTLGEWNSSARLDFYRVADFFNRATNELTTKGYYTFNARVALNSPDGSWRLSLFGRNLTDEVIRYETNEVGTFFGNARTFGVEATWSLQP